MDGVLGRERKLEKKPCANVSSAIRGDSRTTVPSFGHRDPFPRLPPLRASLQHPSILGTVGSDSRVRGSETHERVNRWLNRPGV